MRFDKPVEIIFPAFELNQLAHEFAESEGLVWEDETKGIRNVPTIWITISNENRAVALTNARLPRDETQIVAVSASVLFREPAACERFKNRYFHLELETVELLMLHKTTLGYISIRICESTTLETYLEMVISAKIGEWKIKEIDTLIILSVPEWYDGFDGCSSIHTDKRGYNVITSVASSNVICANIDCLKTFDPVSNSIRCGRCLLCSRIFCCLDCHQATHDVKLRNGLAYCDSGSASFMTTRTNIIAVPNTRRVSMPAFTDTTNIKKASKSQKKINNTDVGSEAKSKAIGMAKEMMLSTIGRICNAIQTGGPKHLDEWEENENNNEINVASNKKQEEKPAEPDEKNFNWKDMQDMLIREEAMEKKHKSKNKKKKKKSKPVEDTKQAPDVPVGDTKDTTPTSEKSDTSSDQNDTDKDETSSDTDNTTNTKSDEDETASLESHETKSEQKQPQIVKQEPVTPKQKYVPQQKQIYNKPPDKKQYKPNNKPYYKVQTQTPSPKPNIQSQPASAPPIKATVNPIVKSPSETQINEAYKVVRQTLSYADALMANQTSVPDPIPAQPEKTSVEKKVDASHTVQQEKSLAAPTAVVPLQTDIKKMEAIASDNTTEKTKSNGTKKKQQQRKHEKPNEPNSKIEAVPVNRQSNAHAPVHQPQYKQVAYAAQYQQQYGMMNQYQHYPHMTYNMVPQPTASLVSVVLPDAYGTYHQVLAPPGVIMPVAPYYTGMYYQR